ncbi:MAG: hypothetical protein JHC26_09755 [Thermofilum sp.]|jgi:hypothetical protein|uniref:hypothetical protein n=1 Tax=Thermofilum sp. TaxID=1961369 RepID=UPI002587DD91|nr:hypothetical protein [Thermofilum sp.]MCI4409366.1 hypothetical protein [Thermofilum sp.]
MVKVVCPRCGQLGYLEKHNVAGNEYLYVVHGYGKKRQKCYIGPVESYSHAEWILSLGLTNIHDIDYFAVAENALTRFIGNVKLKRMKDDEEKIEAYEKLKVAEKRLHEYLEEITRLREEIEKEIESREQG